MDIPFAKNFNLRKRCLRGEQVQASSRTKKTHILSPANAARNIQPKGEIFGITLTPMHNGRG